MKKVSLMIAIIIFFSGCSDGNAGSGGPDAEYRSEMRNFVINISAYAKAINPSFAVIPQNGIELVTVNGESDGEASDKYLNAIDGHGQEDLFYGYNDDDVATPAEDTMYLRSYLDLSKNKGKRILAIDYCSTHSKMDNSYSANSSAGYLSFAADVRNLSNIPSYPSVVVNENSNIITALSDVKNFLYLINPENYVSKSAFITAVTATNYDLIIMDLFFTDGSEFTASEITQLRNKANGGTRMVICYMSIGEAENYRYYWDSSWNVSHPSWLCAENPDWPGNYKVRYWNTEWQDIIFGNDSSYLKKIINAGFDGVYLDIIDAFEYFE